MLRRVQLHRVAFDGNAPVQRPADGDFCILRQGIAQVVQRDIPVGLRRRALVLRRVEVRDVLGNAQRNAADLFAGRERGDDNHVVIARLGLHRDGQQHRARIQVQVY